MENENEGGDDDQYEQLFELDHTFGTKQSQNSNTEGTKKAAIKQFDLMQCRRDLPAFDLLREEDLCNVEMFSLFASFMVDFATNVVPRGVGLEGEKKSNKLKLGTVLQYISGLNMRIIARFPNNQLMKGPKHGAFPPWLTKIRSDIDSFIKARCQKEATPIKKYTPCIGRHILSDICKAYLRLDTQHGYMVRLILVMILAAVGRVGEPAYSSWKLCEWDHDNKCLTTRWQCLKTLTQKFISWHVDYSDSVICFYSSLAAYFITCDITAMQKQVECGHEFIFPSLVNMHPHSVTHKITGFVEERAAY
jgi:hypothetical protein